MEFRRVSELSCCPKCGDWYNLYYNNFQGLYYCKNCNICLCYGDLDSCKEYQEEVIEIEMEAE